MLPQASMYVWIFRCQVSCTCFSKPFLFEFNLFFLPVDFNLSTVQALVFLFRATVQALLTYKARGFGWACYFSRTRPVMLRLTGRADRIRPSILLPLLGEARRLLRETRSAFSSSSEPKSQSKKAGRRPPPPPLFILHLQANPPQSRFFIIYILNRDTAGWIEVGQVMARQRFTAAEHRRRPERRR